MRASQARAEAQRLAEIEKAKNKEGILGYIDRLAGIGASAPFLGMGLGKDIYSTGQAIFGNPEGAAESALDADEYYKRFSDLKSKGIKKGAIRRPDSRGVLPTGKIMTAFNPFAEDVGREKDLFSYTDPEALEELQSQGMFQYGPQTTGAKPRSFPDGTLDTRFDVEGAGAATQDMIDNLKKDLSEGLPKLPQTLPPSPEMAQFIENVKTDPRGGDKSLEGAAQTLGITEEELGSMSKEKKEDALQKAFASGVDSYQEALLGKKKTQPKFKNKQEAIDYYKKEFADATGIKIDGKPDTKDAMIAFGLALMQNKAGKKFDVGKMLEATGEAGEKAMPLLQKARANAKAEAVAAGKYALEQIQSDESSAAASDLAHRKFLREIYLKNLDAELKAGEGKEFKNIYKKEFQIGAKPLKVAYSKVGGETKLAYPSQDVTEVKNRYKDASDGYAITEELKTVLSALQNASNSNATGGSAFEILKDRGKTILKVFGLTDANSLYDNETYEFILENSGEKAAEEYKNNRTSLESSAQVLQDALMARFKRFMTQETGNGIAVYDVESSKVLTGKISYLTPLSKNLQYISELQGLFGHSVDTLDDVIIDFYDKSLYTNEKEMNKTFGVLEDLMKDVYAPLKIDPKNPSQVIDVSDAQT